MNWFRRMFRTRSARKHIALLYILCMFGIIVAAVGISTNWTSLLFITIITYGLVSFIFTSVFLLNWTIKGEDQ